MRKGKKEKKGKKRGGIHPEKKGPDLSPSSVSGVVLVEKGKGRKEKGGQKDGVWT